jgi:hypothetical protein
MLRRFVNTDNAAGVARFWLVELIAVRRLRVKSEQSVAVSLRLDEGAQFAPVREVAKELLDHPAVAVDPDPPAVLILFLLINPADMPHGIYFDLSDTLHLSLT